MNTECTLNISKSNPEIANNLENICFSDVNKLPTIPFNLAKGVSWLSEGESKLVIVIGLDDQVEPVLLLSIQSLRNGQLAGVRMDLEVAHRWGPVEEVCYLKILKATF